MIKKMMIVTVILLTSLMVFACNKEMDWTTVNPENGVYYEIFVRSFADSDDNGIGDFKGITDKLSYLHDLGITGLWLMPIHPSSSYHGYDVEDYYDVNEDYGTMEDFENLVQEANKLGMRIMLDMVFNHTSYQHPWFLAALDGDTTYQNYYNFVPGTTDTAKLTGSWNQNIWHTSDIGKYCGYFSHTMPDLNVFNDDVVDEILNISKFWIDKGVKGFRLDAAHHFFGTNEFIGESYDYFDNVLFLRDYTDEIAAYADDIFIIGEIYEESLYQVVGEYFMGLDSPIDFPVAARIRSSFMNNVNRGYVSNLDTIYTSYREIDSNFISTPFIINHDMDRLASLAYGDQPSMRLATEMLLVLPGNPIIYYGEEIGMYGYKANGPDIWDETRRLPILWGDEYTTDWITSGHATLFAVNEQNENVYTVKEQLQDNESLLSLYKAILQVRNDNIALKYGNSFVPYDGNTGSIQGFYREYEYEDYHQKLLIIHNFGTAESVEIEFDGTIIYLSNTTDFTGINKIPAKSTIIIDVTEGAPDA